MMTQFPGLTNRVARMFSQARPWWAGVQKLNLLPTAQRLQKMKDSGYNTFQLHNSDIFLDMLTDSGVNAMSDDMESAIFLVGLDKFPPVLHCVRAEKAEILPVS